MHRFLVKSFYDAFVVDPHSFAVYLTLTGVRFNFGPPPTFSPQMSAPQGRDFAFHCNA